MTKLFSFTSPPMYTNTYIHTYISLFVDLIKKFFFISVNVSTLYINVYKCIKEQLHEVLKKITSSNSGNNGGLKIPILPTVLNITKQLRNSRRKFVVKVFVQAVV